MAVTETTDAQLLLLTADHECIVLKYTTDECGSPCQRLEPVYDQLSEEEAYQDLLFLRINADSNPVAKKFILNKLAPIITIYHKGRLLESKSVTSEAEIRQLLHELVAEKLKTV